MTIQSECKSGLRDKNHKYVDCGIEVYDGIADIIFTENGQEVLRKQVWVSGHIE